MVRLVFRPYTQVRRSICTLESLRTFTRVSPGFVLLKHSSPSFGSRHVCSHSNHSSLESRSVDSARFLPSRSFTLITRRGLRPEHSHTCQTPWSVFQDGMIRSISFESLPRKTAIRVASETFLSSWRKPNSLIHKWTRYTASHRFLFSNFRYSLTLFSKFFSSFPHGTCSLSVSHQYLALDGIYHPLRAAIPNNSTLRKRTVQLFRGVTGLSPSQALCSKRLLPQTTLVSLLQTTIPKIFSLSFSRFTRRYWGNPC
jgi:hypothetical protein